MAANDCNLTVVIGASAGGLEAIRGLLEELPDDFEAVIVIATHRSPEPGQNHLAGILSRFTKLRVRDPVEGERLACQTLYVGPASKSLVIDGEDARLLDVERQVARLERIDALFETAAKYAGPNAVGVILSGTMWDGVAGLQAISEAGGVCIVQEPFEAKFDGMPINALNAVDVDFVGTVKEIAQRLVEFAGEGRPG